MNFIIPLVSAIVSFVFALTVLDQFFARRKPYQLIWAVGLLMYFIATSSVFWIEAYGLNETAYRLWYLFGAVLVAAYLGMGTLYLLVWRKVAHFAMMLLLVASFYAVFRVFTTTIDLSIIKDLSRDTIPQGLRNMYYLNIFGTVALVGGALYSAWVFWKHRLMRHRVLSNILIALGAILSALGGTLARFGVSSSTAHAVFILLGVVIIFAGFLRNREIFGLPRFPLIHGLGRISDD